MAFNVENFRTSLKYDGARPNLFEVQLPMPTGLADATQAGAKLVFAARAAQLPGVTINPVPVYYMGRRIDLPGNKQFQEWRITVINDEDFLVRSVFERWSGAINAHEENVRRPDFLLGYTVNGKIVQYSKTGPGLRGESRRAARGVNQTDSSQGIRTYKMVGMWPVNIGAIEVNWEADGIEEFTVDFAYHWWEVVGESEESGISARSS